MSQGRTIEFKPQKATLDLGGTTVNPNALYLVDFSKIESVNDLVVILASMGISFSPQHPHFEQVKRFLAMENPIIPQQNIVQPEAKEMNLPKLKSIKK